MYCRNCGRKVEEAKELCDECQAKSNTEKVEVVEEVQNTNPINDNTTSNSNTQTGNGPKVTNTQKSKIAAGLLGIFLGGLGIHNFYLGYNGKAIAQLLITVLSCGFLSLVSGIWGLIEGILILTGDQGTDANGVPLKD